MNDALLSLGEASNIVCTVVSCIMSGTLYCTVPSPLTTQA